MANAEQSHYTTQVYKTYIRPWNTVKRDIATIDRLQFGDQAFTEKVLRMLLTHPDSTAVVLIHALSDRVIGFTQAFPTELIYESYYPEYYLNELGREAREDTAYIGNTAIHPKHMGKHLVGPMMKLLEKELLARGFTHVERDASTNNSYADNIRKNYRDRIEEEQLHASEYGPQVFFRIRLRT